MNKKNLHILLADDDLDDCDFFKDALNDIAIPPRLTTVNNGIELLNYLSRHTETYPDIIFLDLNMPKKSGIECIKEIKSVNKISHIPIVIYSTSYDREVVDQLFDMGAHHYIQKPGAFTNLKKVISKAIKLFNDSNLPPLPSKEGFVIKP